MQQLHVVADQVSGYNMARQDIDIGVQGNDGTGDSIREAFRKVNENFRDLYAVIGDGDLIKSTNLDDFPSSYSGNQIFVVNDPGDAVLAKTIVGANGITIDNSSEEEIIISAGGAKLSGDTNPALGAPLNANNLPIGRVGEPSPTNVTLFNAVHGTNITVDDLAITKGYADRRYLQSTGGSGAGTLRIRTEPVNPSEYTKTIEGYQNGNIKITGHGYDSGSDGIAFKYYSTGTVASPLVAGTTYYLKYVNSVELSIHPTFEDAKNTPGTNRIGVLTGAGSGTQTLVDAFFDPSIPGNFLTNEALPRVSTVRRNGDFMTGPLYLADHPSPLNTNPIPEIPGANEEFLAALNYYVDNNSFASNIHLFVRTSGDDRQTNTPAGKEGRALAYAYATIGAACRKAEELIEVAGNEPGPYRQRLAYTLLGITTESQVQSVTITGGTGFIAVENLLRKNIEYIKAEVIGYINATFPNFNYNQDTCARDVGLIIDAVILDVLFDSNHQSINAGRSYFKNLSARVASGAQKVETIAGINYAKSLADFVLQKINPPVSYQSVYTRQTDLLNSNSTQRAAVASKFTIITDIINGGVATAPSINYGTGLVSFTVDNGGQGFVDQGNPTNVDITPGKILRGIKSNAIARVVSYAPGVSNDTLECTLLTPFNFTLGEEVEFAEANKDLQITIRPESGIYYEDYPIRVPPNVTIRGDDFRRTIIRPKDRASQSPWIETYFYRDTNFDGLDLVTTYNPEAVRLIEANTDYLKREIIEWINRQVAGTAPTYTGLTGTISPSATTSTITGIASTIDLVPGMTVTKTGGSGVFGTNARILSVDSQTQITVIADTANTTGSITFTAGLVPSFTGLVYNQGKCSRDVGLILDALKNDIKYGGNARSYDAAALYYNGAVSKIIGQEVQTAAAISKLKSIVVNYILPRVTFSSLQTAVSQNTTSPSAESAAIPRAGTLLQIVVDVVKNGLSSLPGSYDSPNYGYHYLTNASKVMDLGPSYTNEGGYDEAAKLIEINKEYIKAEVTAFVSAQPGVIPFDTDKSLRDTGLIIDAIVADLREGGRANAVSTAATFLNSAPTVTQAACIAGMNYINTIAQRIILNLAPTVTYQSAVSQIFNNSLTAETGSGADIANLISTVVYAFDPDFNPPKNNSNVDVFLFNDAVRISNITAQGHGGFMCVLDPAGAIGSKSPYVQESGCFSKSINRQTFAGGMFIDGFCGRLKTKIINTSGLEITVNGLTYRRPNSPTAFYYNGFRYQVDNVKSYNASTGVAVLELNPTTPWTSGNLNIVLETPGNRSMLANDFTQVNDLGYGIVAHNTGLTEQVSTFTYYCHTAYLASYGGQIRSVAGSNAQGNFGLKAIGADPTEIPDNVSLKENMTQVAKIYRFDDFSADSQRNDISFYIKRYNYIPSAVSEVEIDHLNGSISRYELRTVTRTGLNESQYTYRITGVTQANPAVVTVMGTTPLSITGITRASPAVVTTSGAHGLVDGDFVTITGVTGMTQINNGSYYIKSTGSNTFALYTDDTLIPELDSITFTSYASGGTVESPIKFYRGDRIAISGVGGMTQLNGNRYYARPLTSNTFEIYNSYDPTTDTLSGAVNSTGFTTYTSGGIVNEKFTYNITGITKANPAQVTFSEAHHFTDGDLVKIESVAGMIQIVGLYYAKRNGTNTIQLYQDPTLATPVNSLSYSTYTSGGTCFGGKEILLISISTNSNDNREANGLTTQLSDHMNIVIRELQNFRFQDVDNVNPTRPSTALEYDATLPDVYRIIAYGVSLADGSKLPPNQAVLTSDTSFLYIKPTSDPTKITTVDPDNGAKTMGSLVGDTKIAIFEISGAENAAKRDLLNTGTLVFAWNGKLHRVTGYTPPSGLIPAYISFTDVIDNNNYGTSPGINRPLSGSSSLVFRTGLPAGSTASITVKISTCRATGHDFLDIGTGGYNTTNYPSAIFGNPATGPFQENEVIEELKGRVFYVSTDQDGIFRVGRFFTVDQGTGTVTFSASIALSNLDGIGFKRGVTVAEFSTDATMTNNATDTVPVQSAIRGYIDKRLGLDHAGNSVPVPNLIGSGYMPLNGGLAMKANFNAGGFNIQNLAAPTDSSDAATKLYVDSQVGLNDELSELSDMVVVNAAAADVLMFTGGNKSATSASITGDIVASYTSNPQTTLVGGITSPPTVDSGIAGSNNIFVSGGIVVADITGFPTSGFIQINGEIFEYTGTTPASNRFDGITRANFTTTASAHIGGSTVRSIAGAQLNLQYAPNSIVNADVSNTALIRQSKLLMNLGGLSASAPTYNIVSSGLLEIGKWYLINTIDNTDWTLVGAASNTVALGFQATGTGYVTAGNFVIGKVYVIILANDTDFTAIGAVDNNPGTSFTATGPGTGTGAAVQGTGTALEWNNLQASNGLSSFNSANFSANAGWISIKDGGVTLPKIANIANARILGNFTGSAAAPQELTASTVGAKTLEALFTTNGALTRTGAETFAVRAIATTATADTLALRDGSGNLTATTFNGALNGNASTATDATNASNVYVAGTARAASTAATSSTIAARDSNGDIFANVFQGVATSARFADLAEFYSSDKNYEPGTVLVFGGSAEVTTTTIFGDSRVAGVVTTNPGFIMNQDLTGTRSCIALQGRVPCKVVGRVKKGDLLTTAGVLGHAAKAVNPQVGTIIGKALQDKDYSEAGVIEVAVGRV